MSAAPVRWVNDYRRAEVILRHKGFREVTFKGLVPLLGKVIVTLEGVPHRERRTLAGRLFWPTFLKTAETGWLVQTINTCLAETGPTADLVKLSYTISCRLAARTIGVDNLDTAGRIERLVGLLSALVSGNQSQHLPMTRRTARDELRKNYLDGAISRRRNLLAIQKAGPIARAEQSPDLISLLLLHPQSQAAQNWDTRQIAAEAAFYLVAAVDTTASLAPHLFHHLWLYSQFHPDQLNLFSDLNFLRLASAEALRLHPAIPAIFREATEAVELPGDLSFLAGQTAGIYVTEANRDQTIFGPDAADFNPFRPIPPKVRRAGLSFGGGAHLCLGRQLAIGTPEQAEPDMIQLYGQAALLARALWQRGAQPDPLRPVCHPTGLTRDVYHSYPIIFNKLILSLDKLNPP